MPGIAGLSLSKKSSESWAFSHLCGKYRRRELSRMLSENRAERNQMEMFCIDSFVPEDHLLRKIDEALDFGKIYEIVGDLY